MTKPTVVITGAGGFIGTALIKNLSKNYHVVALTHAIPKVQEFGVEYLPYDLLNSEPALLFNTADFIIHCAYSPLSEIANIKGAQKIIEQARQLNVKQIIFLSSFSASADSSSNYGKSKYNIEQLLNSNSNLIIRAGLVIGNGGLYKKMVCYLQKHRFIPIVGGGYQPVQTIYIDDLVQIIVAGMEQNISGLYTIAEEKAISFLHFNKLICDKFKWKRIFIKVPIPLISLIFKTTKFFKINISFNQDNLIGLKNSKVQDVSRAIEKFKIRPRSFTNTLKSL